VAYNNAKFSKDGKGLYVTTDKDSEFQRLAYNSVDSQARMSAHRLRAR
jgi:hypothetical protein